MSVNQLSPRSGLDAISARLQSSWPPQLPYPTPWEYRDDGETCVSRLYSSKEEASAVAEIFARASSGYIINDGSLNFCIRKSSNGNWRAMIQNPSVYVHVLLRTFIPYLEQLKKLSNK